jgi:hypothetical protein
MATVTEGVYYRKALFYCASLWAAGLNAKAIHEEMFPVYGGKYMSRKAVHNWVQKRGIRFPDDEEVETEARKRLRQKSKDFHSVGFDALVKRQDKRINVDGGYAEQ